MKAGFLVGLSAAVAFGFTACNTKDDPGNASHRTTELPAGDVVSVRKDGTPAGYEICVKAAYSDKGYHKGETACKGDRTSNEAVPCTPDKHHKKKYPDCKN